MFLRPGSGESNVGIGVHFAKKRLVAQVVRGSISMLGGNLDIVIRRIQIRICAGTKDFERGSRHLVASEFGFVGGNDAGNGEDTGR